MAKGAAADTQNVLNMMTAQIMGRKTDAAAKLTPVQGEVVPTHRVLPNTPAAFPNDVPQEVVLAAVVAIEREVGHILEALGAIRATLGQEAEKPVDLDQVRKVKEREADERAEAEHAAVERAAIETEDDEQAAFDARLAKLQADAEGATYTRAGQAAITAAAEAAQDPDATPKSILIAAVKAGEAAERVADDGGWSCPAHGKFKVELTRRQREYRVCPEAGCKGFERL